MGVSENALLRWESGEAEPMAGNLVKLSHLYGCSPEYLLGYTNERNAKKVC
ncbi:helix-turn-helix domain-containing protein [Gordonibacter urolithinfaciens]|uniref:helix-turn-helix domain-containing protein n=1 Tax=Gordonibacter urolithinfaciens TaxID=1335613 RepID=UPI003A8F7CA3